MSETPAPSLYEQLGGEPAVNAVVERFYGKVLNDDRIKHFFEGIDVNRLMAHQNAFVTLALGGPNRYSGRNLRSAHTRLVERGLNDSHFDAVAENLSTSLRELNVPEPAVAQVGAILESTRNDVLGR